MTRRFMILGSKGQLGAELCSQLDGARFENRELSYVHADYEDCDITDERAVREFFSRHGELDVVFNAAAFTDVDGAEAKPDRAMAVNALGAGNVAAACREIGARLIHFSTDFVFGAGHGDPIDETARPDPLSVYGKTKLAGERLALQNHGATAVVRTSGLYSRWGSNFVRSIADYARKEGRVEVVDDQFITPTPVTTLADIALNMAEGPLFTGGVYHASAHGECTWFEFADEIVGLLDIDAEVVATTAEAWGAAAKRPEYAVLDNHRLRLRGLDLFDRWEEELARFFDAVEAF